MMTEVSNLAERAEIHRALGDESRLRLVDCLIGCDRTPGDLARMAGMTSNLLAFHLHTLEVSGVIERRRSEGDSRRRYVHLRWDRLNMSIPEAQLPSLNRVVFVCTQNSARSQFAEALWRAHGGDDVWSVGSYPGNHVHPYAVDVARNYGLDLTKARPKGYEVVPAEADLVVSVCDRAYESTVPISGSRLHWSVADPVTGDRSAFEEAFSDIATRIEWLRK